VGVGLGEGLGVTVDVGVLLGTGLGEAVGAWTASTGSAGVGSDRLAQAASSRENRSRIVQRRMEGLLF
jgi:hypothetical protein